MNKLEKILCALGFHNWIYIGEEKVLNKRYCDKCRRQEEFCDGHYYRIGNISYIDMKDNY